MQAISLTKGCFLGQELTTRMLHQNLSKKCVAYINTTMPIAVADNKDGSDNEAPSLKDSLGNVWGQLIQHAGCYGLCVMQKDRLQTGHCEQRGNEMKTMLLSAALGLVFANTALAAPGELDRETPVSIEQARLAKDLPQTLVVRVNSATGETQVLHSKTLLAQDSASAQAVIGGKFTQLSKSQRPQNELDRDSSTSSWYFSCQPWYGGYYPTYQYYGYSYSYSYYYGYAYAGWNYSYYRWW
jgi:hypothetical protein